MGFAISQVKTEWKQTFDYGGLPLRSPFFYGNTGKRVL